MLIFLLFACKNPLKDTSVPVPCNPRQIYYVDADGDGVGASEAPYIGCDAPEGYVSVGGDCDDADPQQQDCDTTLDTGIDTGDSGA